MAIILETLFRDFCKYLDGRLKWSDRETAAKAWTDTIFEFFSQQNSKQVIPFVEQREHMRLDYIWRYDTSRYSTNDIELAVEHENVTERLEALIESEIQHLVDLKANNKVGIFYIAQGDEEDFLKAVGQRIGIQSMRFQLERYLVILGYATTRERRRAMLLKSFFFDPYGNVTSWQQQIVRQAS